MRIYRSLLSLPGLAFLVLTCSAQEQSLRVSPVQLIREVVYNELQDHQFHGYWRYWIERRNSGNATLQEQVETASGPITLSEPSDNGRSPAEIRLERQKQIGSLLNSPQEQASHLRQYRQDEDRIGRIVTMLPDAFVFEFEGLDDGNYRLHFEPNPNYSAHSAESRILHAMSGTIWVDARYKHLSRLDGHIDRNVDFGYGVLGRLYKGGWFQLSRVRVGAYDWKTQHLEVHMNIRALLVSNLGRDTSEERGGFVPVPDGITLAEGAELLERSSPQEGFPDLTSQSEISTAR